MYENIYDESHRTSPGLSENGSKVGNDNSSDYVFGQSGGGEKR